MTEINGKPNAVTFRTMEGKNTTEEKMKLIQEAASRKTSKPLKTSHEVYPSCDVEAGIDFLPDTLKALLEGLFSGRKTAVKVASIGQAILQATRPRVLLPPLHAAISPLSRFIIMGSAVHTKRCTSLSEMLLTHTELTFL